MGELRGYGLFFYFVLGNGANYNSYSMVGVVEGFDDSGGLGSAGKEMEIVGGGVGEEVVKDGGSMDG